MGAGEHVLERFFAAVGALDAQAASELVADDYEGYAVEGMPLMGRKRVYRGPEGLRAWIEETAVLVARYELENVRLRRYGDAWVAVGTYKLAGKPLGRSAPVSAVEQTLPFAAVSRLEGEKIRSVHVYESLDAAIEAEKLRD